MLARIRTCCLCGGDYSCTDPKEDLVKLSPQQREIISILAERPTEWHSTKRLVERLYVLDPNGGPNKPEAVVYQQMMAINQRYPNLLDKRRGVGYRLNTTTPNKD